MQTLSQSPFMQALGYAIANSLWQVALLWIIVILCNGIFNFSSQAKYKVALYAQFAGFIWFLITLQFYYIVCCQRITEVQSLQGLASVSSDNFQFKNIYSFLVYCFAKAEQLLPYLSFAYVCLLIFLTARLIRNYQYAQQIKTQSLQKTDVQWRLFIKKIKSLLNIKADVKIYASNLIKSPLTIGFLKPVILIPLASINNLSTEQMEAVILHELAHIKRADYLINLFQCVIETGLFFNPFTQLLSSIIKKERENSCDDWVLQFQYQPEMYADALLRIACFQTQAVIAMQAANSKGDLLLRVKRMIGRNEKTFNYRQQLIALLVMTFILSSFAWFQPSVQKNISISNYAKQIKPIIKSDATKATNPLFDPTFLLPKTEKKEWNEIINNDDKKLNVADSKNNFANNIADNFKIINTEDELNKIFRASKDSLQQYILLNNKNFSYSKYIENLIDTASLAASLKNSAEEIKSFDAQEIKKNLLKAQQQLEQIKSLNLKKIQNDVYTKALIIMDKENNLVAPNAASLNDQNELLQKKIELENFELQIKKMKLSKQKMDSLNAPDAFNYTNDGANNWCVSYPVYIEQANNDAEKNYAVAISDNQKDSTISNDKNVQIHFQKSVHTSCNNIEIHKSEDGQSINIMIEIL